MRTLAHYELNKVVYQGGMGTIYEAFDTKLERTVALKVLNTSGDSELDEDALSEARFLARLNHPNIIQVFDCGQSDGQQYLVMEFCRGKNLLQYQKQHVLTLEQKLAMLVDIAKGLEHAHRNSIIHRDLKPSNILISEAGQVKVADFGIAGFVGGNSHVSQSAGTKGYMSPEQLQGQALSHHSDWFSFAVVAIELLTGEHPFAGQGGQDISAAILQGHHLDLSTTQLPQQLQALLGQALSVKPAARLNLRRGPFSKQLEQLLQQRVQAAILEQQTEPVTPSNTTHKSAPLRAKKLRWRYLVMAFVCAAVLVGGYLLRPYLLHQPVVAILPTQIYNLPDEFKHYESALKGSVQSAMWQQLLQQDQQLVSRAEMNMLAQGQDSDQFRDPKSYFQRLADYTGADTLISSSLDCQQRHCSVEISTLRAPNWQVQESMQWQTDIAGTTNLHDVAKYNTARLISPGIDSEEYRSLSTMKSNSPLFEMYTLFYVDNVATPEMFEKSLATVKESATSVEGYNLLREIALQLYHSTHEKAYLKQAISAIHNAPGEFKKLSSYYKSLVLLNIELGQIEEAKHALDMLTKVSHDQAAILNLEASILLAEGEDKQARDKLEVALSLRPNLRLQRKLALVLYWLGDFQSAKNLLADLVEKVPSDIRTHQYLADIALIEGDFTSAIESYSKTLNENSDSIDLSNLSIAYMMVQNYPMAEKFAKQALLSSPKNTGMMLNMADINMLNGKLVESKELYERLLQLNNGRESALAWSENAQAYAQLGDNEQAIKSLKHSFKLAEDKSELSYTAALVHALGGDFNSSLYYVEEALKSGYHQNWFLQPWFKPLCDFEKFRAMVSSHSQLCVN